jgi:3-oxoacyl-(acyl-carrier-protein) synthase
MAGCVTYTRRFYDETLCDPATASPLVFPETVFNAPASHLAAILGSREINYTLVGDAGAFLSALAIAADWLSEGAVDAALVVSSEESDWITADAARRFDRNVIVSEGAGALYLHPGPPKPGGVWLASITDAHAYLQHRPRGRAIQEMRDQLPPGAAADLLCDSCGGSKKADADEIAVWKSWPGARISPKAIFGEGLAAGSAWQCVAAVDALRQGRHPRALVSVAGPNQQAIGACFAAR